MAIIVSGNVLEQKSAQSQSAIAHIMSCSMEPKEYFLGRKIQMSRIRLEQTNPNTSTHAAVSDVHDIESSKGLLPIATLGVSSDVTSLLTLVLCDSASTHSWVSSSLVNHLGLVGEPVNLSISGFNSTTVVETQRVKFTVSSEPNNSDFVFSLCAYVKDSIRIGSELINIADLQNKYPQLAPIKPIQYTYEDVEVIIGQDYYHAVRPIEFILGDDKNSPCSVRLPIGWVLSGPLPPSGNSTSSCFKCVVEDSSLTDQIKSWYELESYGAFKQVNARSAADKHALSILNSETVHNGERYIVPMLWIDSNVSLPNNYYSSLAQFKSLERRLSKDPELRERYAETIREDIRKGYVVTVEPHDPRKRSDREWYLPHQPVVNPNKPGKVRRVLNGASNFAPFFVAGGYHFRCGSSSVHSPYIRRTGFAYVRQFRVA